MANLVDHSLLVPQKSAAPTWPGALANTAWAAGPSLLFGLRLWAAVCLALYVAFRLELDNAYWAGTSAAIMCQPHLGASLRKGWFRMIGTVVGAVAIVVLSALFPQERAYFLIGLALWGAACALAATLLHNFAAYAAALAGYTAAIIAYDELGATGGTDGGAFMFAITRVSEIWIGIACAGVVLAGTDLGGAKRRLAALFAELAAEIASRFAATLALVGATAAGTGLSRDAILQQPLRRELIRQVTALDPVIDEVIGESPTIRYHSPVLWTANAGLFAALAAWRTAVVRLARLPEGAARQDALAVLRRVPRELQIGVPPGQPSPWTADPLGMRQLSVAGMRMLIAMPANTPSLRLLAVQTARLLAGLSHVLDALALLVAEPARRRPEGRLSLYVPDWLPAFVNAGRAFVTIGAVALFWIVSAWPSGAQAITFAAIVVILAAPRADEAYAMSMSYMLGTCLTAVCAAIIEFACLPHVQSFAGFSLWMGVFLVPAGALLAQPWQTAVFAALVGNFVPLLGPANQMDYDQVHFFNSALAIVAGCGAAAMSFRLLPPLSPAFRTRRLLGLSLRQLRRLATAPVGRLPDDWEGRMASRLAALPEGAEPLQRSQLVAALTVGNEIIRLRRTMPHLGCGAALDRALGALAQGDSAASIAGLAELDDRLASCPDAETVLANRERARILAVSDALAQHQDYFDAGAPA